MKSAVVDSTSEGGTRCSSLTLRHLLEHFEPLAETPEATTKLRKAIVKLAVSGRLVRQEGSDEPLSAAAERFKLPKPKAKPQPDSLPNWERWRMNDLLEIQYGFAFESSRFVESNDGTPLIRIRDISSTSTVVHYVGDYSSDYLVATGDYLVGMDGDFNLRRWKGPRALLNQRVCRLHGFSPVLNPAFAALAIQEQLDTIHGETSYVTVKHLSAKQLNAMCLALPPLREQRCIVAKVEELLALCDELEARQVATREHGTRLVHSALDHLTAAKDEQDFQKQCSFILHNSSLILDSVPALRRAILSLAVEGRLGTREESDLPAQVELDLIRAEKKQLALHKASVLPPIDELEHPFPLPHGWAWARWAEISDWITYGFTRPMAHLEAGIPIATAKHVLDGRLDLSDSHKTDDDSFAALSEKDRPVPGDILLTTDGSIGRAAIVPPDQRFCINQSVAVIWLRSCHLPREYLLLAIRSPWMQRPIWAAAEGMAIKHISVVDFGKMLLPVPPLAEQRRIVAKVDELMRLCGALEARLAAAQTAATHLLDATLDRAIKREL
jgi:type I restriction enzyme S subunit